jgi:hypothetical protein
MIGDDDWGLMEVGKDKVRLPFELVGLSLSLYIYILFQPFLYKNVESANCLGERGSLELCLLFNLMKSIFITEELI